MKITIELTTPEVRTLGNWASLGRTITNAECRMLDLMSSLPPDQTTDRERDMQKELAHTAYDELKVLHAPLDSLHGKVRSEIWKQWAPLVAVIHTQYRDGDITFATAEQALFMLGYERYKAKESLRNIDEMKEAV